jgi:hypothetical protein
LDLLEKYLAEATTLSIDQKVRWAGEYPLTVLNETLRKIFSRFGVGSVRDLVDAYPNLVRRDVLDKILLDIGLEIVRYETIRRHFSDFVLQYGIPELNTTTVGGGAPGMTDSPGSVGGSNNRAASSVQNGHSSSNPHESGGIDTTAGDSQGGVAQQPLSKKRAGTPAASIYDPKSVRQALRRLKPVGQNRAKVVALRDEALELDLDRTPLAFCFLFRSMFELSAKAYCEDHESAGGPKATHANGKDRHLVEVLKDITDHITNETKDTGMIRRLHGAKVELGNSNGFLSVTSMNQLIHSPHFSITSKDICSLFHNVFPLIQAMNSRDP